VAIPKFIYFTTLYPFCCVKILNHCAAMFANFALLKEKIVAKISKPILELATLAYLLVAYGLFQVALPNLFF
jgi:hypothetical protein